MRMLQLFGSSRAQKCECCSFLAHRELKSANVSAFWLIESSKVRMFKLFGSSRSQKCRRISSFAHRELQKCECFSFLGHRELKSANVSTLCAPLSVMPTPANTAFAFLSRMMGSDLAFAICVTIWPDLTPPTRRNYFDSSLPARRLRRRPAAQWSEDTRWRPGREKKGHI